jgi:hypothetical protein
MRTKTRSAYAVADLSTRLVRELVVGDADTTLVEGDGGTEATTIVALPSSRGPVLSGTQHQGVHVHMHMYMVNYSRSMRFF